MLAFLKQTKKRGLLDCDDNWMAVMKDAINANMNESKRISHFAQLLFSNRRWMQSKCLRSYLMSFYLNHRTHKTRKYRPRYESK